MKFTEPKPIFENGSTNKRAKYSNDLKQYRAKRSAYMRIYKILKKDGNKFIPIYIGIAFYQALYKTISRHFQKHNDPFQGRYVIQDKNPEKWYFSLSEKIFDSIKDLKDEESVQILVDKPEGNRVFNAGQKDMGAIDPETGEIDPNWKPPKWEVAKAKAEQVLAYYEQPTELGFVKAEQAREWLKEHRRLSQMAYRKDPILKDEIPSPKELKQIK